MPTSSKLENVDFESTDDVVDVVDDDVLENGDDDNSCKDETVVRIEEDNDIGNGDNYE